MIEESKPPLTDRLLEEHLDHEGLIDNCIANLQGGRTFEDWLDFMKDQYDLTDELAEYVKSGVADNIFSQFIYKKYAYRVKNMSMADTLYDIASKLVQVNENPQGPEDDYFVGTEEKFKSLDSELKKAGIEFTKIKVVHIV